MNLLVIALFVSVFSLNYLARALEVLPVYFLLVPDALSAMTMLLVFGRLLGGSRLALDWRYGLFLLLFLFVIVFGFIAQAVSSGAIIVGVRNYLKFLPFLLLPAVYPFTERQLKHQLACLLILLVLQVPVSLYQRFIQYSDSWHTGDYVRGTVSDSGSLSLLMLCGVAVAVVFYLRKVIRLPLMVLAIVLLFVPTTLNETKVTLVVLPMAVLIPALFMPPGQRALGRLLPILGVGVLAGLAFIAAYNFFSQYQEYGQSIAEYFENRSIERYLYTGAAEGNRTAIGRFDSIALASKQLARDPLAMAFGLGAGNISSSPVPGFKGEFAAYQDRFGAGLTQVTAFLWEIGLMGLGVYLFFYFIVFQDARWLARSTTGMAPLGQVWATILAIMTLGLFYASIFGMDELGYLFWFYCGVVASNAHAQRKLARDAVANARHGRIRNRRTELNVVHP